MEDKKQSQNTGVIIAVVVLLVAAIGLVWYFMNEVETDNDTTTEQTETVDGDEISEPTIAEFVDGNPDFSTLATALEVADLVDVLDGPGEYTVFAPTNEAFDALPEGALEDLLEDPEALRNVLLYHVVDGVVASGDVVELDQFEAFQGGTVTVDLVESEAGADVVLNGSAVVTSVDVSASNGVIHVIDSVLLP